MKPSAGLIAGARGMSGKYREDVSTELSARGEREL